MHDLPLFQNRSETAETLLREVNTGRLDPLAEAERFSRLCKEFQFRQEQVAEATGRSRAAVANRIRLLDLPVPLRVAVAEGTLSVGHAKVILSAPTEEARLALGEAVLKEQLSVRETQKRLDFLRNPKTAPGPGEHLPLWQQRFSAYLGAEVTFSGSEEEGWIRISHQGIDDLQRLANLMGLPE